MISDGRILGCHACRHGIRQLRSCWQDGTGYITECPIQPGNSEIYDFIVLHQRGTVFWHAHVSWVRASVHGAFITLPTNGYPFPKPDGEYPIILGKSPLEIAAMVSGRFNSLYRTENEVDEKLAST